MPGTAAKIRVLTRRELALVLADLHAKAPCSPYAALNLVLDRLAMLTIHHGRHTFISHALAGDRKLAEVRDAAGHANVSITSA